MIFGLGIFALATFANSTGLVLDPDTSIWKLIKPAIGDYTIIGGS